MRHIATLLAILCLVLNQSCLIKPPEQIPDQWNPVFTDELITPIRNIYNGIAQFYIVSDDEFVRIDNNNAVVERRRINLPDRFFGRPTLSENIFIRTTRLDTAQVIEFHLTKVDGVVEYLRVEDIEQQTGDLLSHLSKGRYTAAFNDLGSQILIPFENDSKNIYSFALIDIRLNGTNSDFEFITLRRVLEVEEQPVDPDGLHNVRFINGNYYVTSTNGVTRITPQGTVQHVTPLWIFDIFEQEGKIYGTGAGGGLYLSQDNGINWERDNRDSEPTSLIYVEKVNDEIFTQRFTGAPFSKAEEDLLDIKKIRLNENFTEDLGAYNNIRYFFGRHYLGVQKQLYFSDDLQLED
ncbi:MAG: hypothetical protein AAFV25_22255 [Bacteroidota bacterium]